MNNEVNEVTVKTVLARTFGRPDTLRGEFKDSADEAREHLEELGPDIDLQIFLAWYAAWYPHAGHSEMGRVVRDFASSRGIRMNPRPKRQKVQKG